MERKIVKDTLFLQQISEPAHPEDLAIGQDLLDTLAANREVCVGLAANMIGIKKRIIVIHMGMFDLLMFNPIIRKKSAPYTTEEGCLSLSGSRSTIRYREIEVDYRDKNWNKQTITLHDFPAQICQHELDHLEGILI